MQKPRKRFLSAIVAVAMCLSQFAPVTAYAVESASGITQSEEAPRETDALSTTTTNSDSSATTPAPKSDVTDTASSASSDTSVTSDVSSEATSQAGSETTTAYANSAASDTGASTSTSSEASTTGSISEAAQAFIDAANALVSRKDEILTAANNFGLASKAWQADKENAVLDAMVTRRTEELDAVYDWEPIEDMYYSLSEDEQVAEPVMNAYLDMSDLYLQVCDRQENPVDNSGASAFDGGGSTTVIGDYQAITAAETGKQIAAGTGIQYTKISGQENVIRILPQTVTYTYGDSFKSKGLTIEYSTADSRTSQEVEKDIQAAIDGLSFIMYAPADGDGQNPTDIHCNAGTYPTYVDAFRTNVFLTCVYNDETREGAYGIVVDMGDKRIIHGMCGHTSDEWEYGFAGAIEAMRICTENNVKEIMFVVLDPLCEILQQNADGLRWGYSYTRSQFTKAIDVLKREAAIGFIPEHVESEFQDLAETIAKTLVFPVND